MLPILSAAFFQLFISYKNLIRFFLTKGYDECVEKAIFSPASSLRCHMWGRRNTKYVWLKKLLLS